MSNRLGWDKGGAGSRLLGDEISQLHVVGAQAGEPVQQGNFTRMNKRQIRNHLHRTNNGSTIRHDSLYMEINVHTCILHTSFKKTRKEG